MLKNFIVDNDLKKYHPKLANYLWSTQSDYSTQIAEAFNVILDDLRAKEIEPRTLMIPLDLKRSADSTDRQHTILTSSTETSTTTGTHVNGYSGFNRFFVNVTAFSNPLNGYVFKLQGSNEQQINASTEPTNWTDIVSLTGTGQGGEFSGVFQNEFKYYRYVNTVTGSSVTYEIGLYETYVDRWIIYKTFEMIFRDFAKSPDDIWYDRMRQMQNMYDTALRSYKFSVDEDDNNIINDADSLTSSAQVIFTR